jgi:hypothetical protein
MKIWHYIKFLFLQLVTLNYSVLKYFIDQNKTIIENY